MYQTQPYKRLHGLSTAHLLSTSLYHPTYLITLPFDYDQLPRYRSDNILFRVHERWDWYRKARELNGALGTLAYLPAEIRLLIWQNLLYCRDTLSSDGLWEYGARGSPYQLSAYYFGFGRRGDFFGNAENLRLVSTQIKAEFDHVVCILLTSD